MIDLEKGQQASLAISPTDTVTARLIWDGGSATRRAMGADLDLYLFYVPRDEVSTTPLESSDVVWHRKLGSARRQPYIKLDGDSRRPGAETARIGHPERQGYVLISAYSALRNGAGSFRSYGAHVVVSGAAQQVTVRLRKRSPFAFWAAIALVDFTDPTNVRITNVEDYSGLWGGEKRPMLYRNGTFRMSGGSIESERKKKLAVRR